MSQPIEWRLATAERERDAFAEKISAFQQEIARLTAEVGGLREFVNKFENDEASVCPEDVGFVEWIGVLAKQRDTLKRENEAFQAAARETLYGKDHTVLGNGHCIKYRARSIELWHKDPNFDVVKAAQEIQELQEKSHKELVEFSRKVLPDRAEAAAREALDSAIKGKG